MNEILLSLILICLINLFLYLCYRYYEFKWPENYFGINDKENIFLTIKPYYYFLFRILPVGISIILFLGSAIKMFPGSFNTALVGTLSALIFSLINDGRAIRSLLYKSSKIKYFRNAYYQYLLHLVTIAILTICGFISGYISSNSFILEWVIPDIKSLRDNIYASFIAIVISFALYKTFKKPKEITFEEVIKKGSNNIDLELLKLIESECIKLKADSQLGKAVCITENIERPKWVRTLEYLFGIIKKRGTYGIMQVYSEHPINDKESIKIAIEKYFSNTLNNFNIISIIRRYNDDDKYVELVQEVYRSISE